MTAKKTAPPSSKATKAKSPGEKTDTTPPSKSGSVKSSLKAESMSAEPPPPPPPTAEELRQAAFQQRFENVQLAAHMDVQRLALFALGIFEVVLLHHTHDSGSAGVGSGCDTCAKLKNLKARALDKVILFDRDDPR